MRLFVIFLLVFLSSKDGLSQKDNLLTRNIYRNVPELNVLDTITWADIKNHFSFGSTFVNYIFQLDSNDKFKYREFGCLGTITLDSGTWSIKKNNILVLKSRKKIYNFDVVRFGKFLFYITPEQRLEFVSDFKKEQNDAGDKKIDFGDPDYTKDYLIAWDLSRKYYQSELIY